MEARHFFGRFYLVGKTACEGGEGVRGGDVPFDVLATDAYVV